MGMKRWLVFGLGGLVVAASATVLGAGCSETPRETVVGSRGDSGTVSTAPPDAASDSPPTSARTSSAPLPHADDRATTPGAVTSRDEAIARILRNQRLAKGVQRSDAKRATMAEWMRASGRGGNGATPQHDGSAAVWVVALSGDLEVGSGVTHRSYVAVIDADTGLLVYESASREEWPKGFDELAG